jgi:murein L,D-transpeptidase YcbB/YkuD
MSRAIYCQAVDRRRISLVLFSAAALGFAGCTSGTSPKTAASSSTIATIASTVTAAGSTTSTVPIAGATTSAPTTPYAPGQTATTVGATKSTTAAAATTVAGRVVTKPSDNVHLGDTGPGVKTIQMALVAHGYKVSIDSRFGAQTAQAVKDFQKKSGVKQDGIVGPITWAKLQASSTATTTTIAKGTTTTTH